jgi:hypothetical protein
MYLREQRPLTSKERQQLCNAVPEPKSRWQWFLDWYLNAMIVMAIVWIVVAWQRNWIAATLAVVAYFFIEKVLLGSLKASFEQLRFLRTERANRDRLLKFLAEADSVTVESVESGRVIAIYGDDCELYLFDVGDNQLYWSSVGQPKSKWPNSSFEIVQVSGFDDVLPPACRGTKLNPVAEIEFRELGEFELPKENPFAGSLDEIMHRARAQVG